MLKGAQEKRPCGRQVDPTGFVAMVLEAFMGVTLDEIIHDYLLSFNSIFDSNIHDDANSLVVIKLLSIMSDSLAPGAFRPNL
jgi:hypothetical protein